MPILFVLWTISFHFLIRIDCCSKCMSDNFHHNHLVSFGTIERNISSSNFQWENRINSHKFSSKVFITFFRHIRHTMNISHVNRWKKNIWKTFCKSFFFFFLSHSFSSLTLPLPAFYVFFTFHKQKSFHSIICIFCIRNCIYLFTEKRKINCFCNAHTCSM